MDLRARLGQVKEYFIMFKICFDISSVPAPLAFPLCQLCHIPLHRSDLHKDVIKGSEILEVLHQTPEVITITQTMALQDIVQVRHYLFSLYNCQYSDFFTALGKLEQVLNRESLPPVNPDISKY